MRFVVIRDEVVRPRSFRFGGCGGDGRGGGGRGGCNRNAVPILGRVGDSPDVSMVVKGDANEEELSVGAERETTGDAAGSGGAAGEMVEQDRSFERQGLGGAEATALRADDQGDAFGSEGMPPIHAGDDHGNFDPQSGASAGGFGSDDFHVQQALVGGPTIKFDRGEADWS